MQTIRLKVGDTGWLINAELPQASDAEFWLDWPQWFERNFDVFRPWQPGRRTIVGRKPDFLKKGENVIAKRYVIGGTKDRLKKILGVSRAKRAYQLAATLTAAGIRTARPLAAGTRRGESVLLTEELTGAVPLRQFRVDNHNQSRQVRAIRQLGRILGKLYSLGYVHGDPTLSNFFVENRTQEILLIDLDAVRRPAINRRSELKTSLRALLRKIPLTPREKSWFLAEFARASKLSLQVLCMLTK